MLGPFAGLAQALPIRMSNVSFKPKALMEVCSQVDKRSFRLLFWEWISYLSSAWNACLLRTQ